MWYKEQMSVLIGNSTPYTKIRFRQPSTVSDGCAFSHHQLAALKGTDRAVHHGEGVERNWISFTYQCDSSLEMLPRDPASRTQEGNCFLVLCLPFSLRRPLPSSAPNGQRLASPPYFSVLPTILAAHMSSYRPNNFGSPSSPGSLITFWGSALNAPFPASFLKVCIAPRCLSAAEVRETNILQPSSLLQHQTSL